MRIDIGGVKVGEHIMQDAGKCYAQCASMKNQCTAVRMMKSDGEYTCQVLKRLHHTEHLVAYPVIQVAKKSGAYHRWKH